MKKTLLILTLVLALLALTACQATVVLDDIAQQLHDANTAPASDTTAAETGGALPAGETADAAEPDDASASNAEAEDETETPEVADAALSLPVEEVTVDFTALPLDSLVADAEDAPGQLPVIALDCPGANDINADIEGTFRYLVDDESCRLWYQAFKNDGVLSVLIAQNYDGDCSYYTPYNLDLATGERLSGAELLARLGADPTVVGDTEIAVMAEEFEHLYGAASEGEGAAFYQEQYERTISPDNVELSRLWLADGGQLYFVGKLYSLAGAEFYEYMLPTGFQF